MRRKYDFKDISTLMNLIQRRKCFCFGAGRQLMEICEDISELAGCIDGIIDNNPNLHFTKKKIRDRAIPIFSPEYLIEQDLENTLLLITSSYKDEIIAGLEKVRELDDLEYADFQDVLDTAAWSCPGPIERFRKNETMVIPKIVHYCWFGGARMPDRLRQYVDGWKQMLPDYEFIEWNDKNYDVTKNSYMYSAYQNRKWSFVTDYVRVDAVYSNGGIYLDTDVELIRRPDELLYNDAYIGFERLSTVNTGAGFGAVKGFPILGELLDFYANREFINNEDPNKMILCPVYETELLKKHGLTSNGSFQIVDDMCVYPVEYFNAKSLYSNRLRITDRTISVHHCTWTWAGEKSKL